MGTVRFPLSVVANVKQSIKLARQTSIAILETPAPSTSGKKFTHSTHLAVLGNVTVREKIVTEKRVVQQCLAMKTDAFSCSPFAASPGPNLQNAVHEAGVSEIVQAAHAHGAHCWSSQQRWQGTGVVVLHDRSSSVRNERLETAHWCKRREAGKHRGGFCWRSCIVPSVVIENTHTHTHR
jgi:hypothetical protein